MNDHRILFFKIITENDLFLVENGKKINLLLFKILVILFLLNSFLTFCMFFFYNKRREKNSFFFSLNQKKNRFLKIYILLEWISLTKYHLIKKEREMREEERKKKKIEKKKE